MNNKTEIIMKTMENITMVNLENPAHLEAKGLAKCWEAYSENASSEDIMEVGFNDQSHFTRIFRRYTGASPSAYRKNLNSAHASLVP